MKPLTARQQEVLDFIRKHIADHGMPPTHREISEAFGFSRAGAATADHLRALARKGAIKVEFGKNRAIQVIDDVAPPEPAPRKVAVFWAIPSALDRGPVAGTGFVVLVDGREIAPLSAPMDTLEEAIAVAEEVKAVEEEAFMEEQSVRQGRAAAPMLAAGGPS